MELDLKLNINLSVIIDEETKTCTITNQNIQIQTPSSLPLKMERTLGVAEIRYGIFTLGSKSIIGRVLPRDADINVVYNGHLYPAHTHKSSGGRIDRLTSLLKHFHVNSPVVFEYDISKNELIVSEP